MGSTGKEGSPWTTGVDKEFLDLMAAASEGVTTAAVAARFAMPLLSSTGLKAGGSGTSGDLNMEPSLTWAAMDSWPAGGTNPTLDPYDIMESKSPLI